MTARIQRSFDFMAGVHFGTDFYSNLYEFDASFDVESESIEEQNVALERIKYFLYTGLQHSVMIADKDQAVISKMADIGMRACILPEEPYDQIVGIMLMTKINAISEGRIIMTDIAITSKLSDGVLCLHSIEENTGPFKLNGWWNDPSPNLSETKQKGKKVIALKKTTHSWNDFNLDWVITEPKKAESEIVFVNFDKLDK